MPTVPLLASVADLNASVTSGGASQLVPSGVIMSFAGATAPTGWLLCNGAAISRTIYGNLFTALGGASSPYGLGDGSTTFNLPNCQGIFISGSGSQTINSITYTKTHGQRQNEATKRPTTAFTTAASSVTGTTGQSDRPVYANNGNKPNQAFSTFNAPGFSSGDNIDNVTAHVHSFTGTAAASSVTGGGDAETRPANIAMNYIIKT